jgi:hypothetical protein
MTSAPELPGGLELIRWLTANGIIASVGIRMPITILRWRRLTLVRNVRRICTTR